MGHYDFLTGVDLRHLETYRYLEEVRTTRGYDRSYV